MPTLLGRAQLALNRSRDLGVDLAMGEVTVGLTLCDVARHHQGQERQTIVVLARRCLGRARSTIGRLDASDHQNAVFDEHWEKLALVLASMNAPKTNHRSSRGF